LCIDLHNQNKDDRFDSLSRIKAAPGNTCPLRSVTTTAEPSP
jgi:hypothetical protein